MFELFQPTHLLFVFVVALMVCPKRLVEMSRSLGQTIRTLHEYKEELKEEMSTAIEDKPQEKHSVKEG